MNVTVLLADYAQGTPGQKVNALGLGWTEVPTPLPAHSVVLLVEMDPDETGKTHHLEIRLVDKSGDVVADPLGNKLQLGAELRVEHDGPTRVAGIAPVTFLLGAGMPLAPGVYRWEVTARDAAPDTRWVRPFNVLGEPDREDIDA